MEEENWHKVRRLFEAACDLPPARWEQTLAGMTGDAQAIAEALALLQSQDRSDERVRGVVESLLRQAGGGEPVEGELLGPWRLRRRLAAGGMGVVFLAERADGLYAREVAIKLLRGQASERVASQLSAECRILAGLSHPGISRLYDVGLTADQRPYLVMEYVRGQRLDAWSCGSGAGLEQRLALFEAICAAVQYAHARLVLHCDLKPGNILVGEDGKPVLLDFGVARLAGASGQAGAYCTPAYAAPELLKPGATVDTRADVHCLGLLLCELLAMASAARAPGRAEIPLPSVLAGSQVAWRRQLRGDADAIVARACAQDPEQRYPSVEALAADVRAMSARHPVAARGGGRAYRLQRWLQRHWRGVGLLVVVLLLGALFVWQLELQRQQAQRQARIADEVTGFLVAAFDAANPRKGSLPGNGQVSARQVLDASAERIDGQQWDDPLVKARLQATLAQAYQNLGLGALAEELYRQAVPVLVGNASRAGNQALLPVLNEYAVLLANRMHGERSEAVARQALALVDPHTQPGAAARSYNALGLALSAQRRFDDSEQAFTRALELHRRNRSDVLSVSMILQNHALMLIDRGHYAQAETLLRRAGRMRLVLGRKTSEWYGGQYLLLRALAAQGKYAEALRTAAVLEPMTEAIYGSHSEKRAELGNEMASILQDSGHYAESAQRYAQVLALYRELSDKPDMAIARTLNNMATLEQLRGGLQQARALFEQSLELRYRVLGRQAPAVWQVQTNLGRLLVEMGDARAAEPLLAEAAAGWQQRVPAEHPQRLLNTLARAELALLKGEPAGAADLLDEVAGQLSAGTDLRIGRRYLDVLARLQLAQGNPQAAVDSQRRLLAQLRQQLGEASVPAAQQQARLAVLLAGAGRCAPAREQARQALPLLAPMHADSLLRRQAQALAAGQCSAPRA